MPLVGFGLWKVYANEAADCVYNAIKTGYRMLDGAHCYENEKAILERSHGANFGDSKGRRGDRVSTKKPDFKNDRTIQSQTIADNRPLIWESLDEKDLRVLSWFYLIPETR